MLAFFRRLLIIASLYYFMSIEVEAVSVTTQPVEVSNEDLLSYIAEKVLRAMRRNKKLRSPYAIASRLLQKQTEKGTLAGMRFYTEDQRNEVAAIVSMGIESQFYADHLSPAQVVILAKIESRLLRYVSESLDYDPEMVNSACSLVGQLIGHALARSKNQVSMLSDDNFSDPFHLMCLFFDRDFEALQEMLQMRAELQEIFASKKHKTTW